MGITKSLESFEKTVFIRTIQNYTPKGPFQSKEQMPKNISDAQLTFS